MSNNKKKVDEVDEKPPKGINYNSMPLPTKIVTRADAAAVLASLTPPFNDKKPLKDINYNSMPPPTKIVTPADAAAVLASLTPPFNDTYIYHDKKHSHKHTVDDKLSKKQLKRSISFNPRQTAPAPYIDFAEVLATTVSLVRENNKKLDRLSDEIRITDKAAIMIWILIIVLTLINSQAII
ncbi:5941_t:CDS:2, partial [Funneliformis mosseae]